MLNRLGHWQSWLAGDRALAAVALLGVAFILWGVSLPPYRDAGAAEHIFLAACDRASKEIPGWWKRLDALRTNRYPLLNSGLSLVLAAGTLFGLRWILGWQNWRKIGVVLTPSRRWHFHVIGTFVIVAIWMGFVFALRVELSRDFYPDCADTIGIPLYYGTLGYFLTWLICLLLGSLVILAFGVLPVPLDSWDKDRPIRSWACSIVAGLIIAGISLITMSTLLTASFLAIPGSIVGVYLVAATRAALLAPRAVGPDKQ